MVGGETEEILVDFGKICRLCLSEDGVLISLYNSGPVLDNCMKSISEKILDLMAIKVTKDDGFPTWVCRNCLSLVDKCYEFFEMCRNSQMTLYESYIKALTEAGVNETLIQNYLAEKGYLVFATNTEKEKTEEVISKYTCKSISENIKEEYISDQEEKPDEELDEEVVEEKYFCSDCAKVFTNKEELLIHRISVHHDDLVSETSNVDSSGNKVTGIWTCDACGAKFRKRSAIVTHIRCQHLKSDKEATPPKRLALCKYCGSSFTRSSLSKHLETTHRHMKGLKLDQAEIGAFDCRICFRPFMRRSSLRSHIEKFHGDSLEVMAKAENCEIVWSCNICDSLFYEEVFLMQHYGRKHSKYPLEVDSLRTLKSKDLICTCGMISSNGLDSSIHDVFYHFENTKSEEAMACPSCDKSFYCLTELKKHLISFHWYVATSYENECAFCDCEFNSNDQLRVHLHKHHDISFEKLAIEEKTVKDKKLKLVENEKVEMIDVSVPEEANEVNSIEDPNNSSVSLFICESCGTYFETEEDFKTHSETCQSNHVCTLCYKTYKSGTHLKRHIAEYHKTMNPIKCPLCPKVFPRKMNMHNHYKRRHLKQAKKFVCSYCGQSLKGKVALKSHEDRLHLNIRNYQCPECPEAFTTRNILRKHAQRHLADRPMLQCQHCERKFSTISGIERHVKTHEGVKDFVCDRDMCGKSFYTNSELKRHIKFHVRDFRYICPVCNHKFMSPGELKKHSTKHTGERPFKCHLCSSAYARRDDKVKHLKRVHNLRVKRIYGKPLRRFSDVDSEIIDTIIIDDGTAEVSLQSEVLYEESAVLP